MCRSTIGRMLILALGVLVASLAAQAQGVGKGVRVGVPFPGLAAGSPGPPAFQQRL